MSFDLSALPTYTTAQKLLAVDKAIVDVLMGGASVTHNGRTLTRADLDKLRKLKEHFEQEAADESTESPGGIALMQYGDPVDGASRSECD
jgi:hypothetical protein